MMRTFPDFLNLNERFIAKSFHNLNISEILLKGGKTNSE